MLSVQNLSQQFYFQNYQKQNKLDMSKMKLKLTHSSKDQHFSQDEINQLRQTQEIEQMLSSPEVKKFEAFLFESITCKQWLSKKFSQFTPLPQRVINFYESEFSLNHSHDHQNSEQ
ncbi:unnamed protein product (macronuclear) [Paramecium tetraurelia]|uniref:Uncharacterized protein n=1 Tax=Paramecium tetraurelia TaxID=5888 RepID=A0EIA6_PARTE|nr:uncharacterized protein GSPATT00027376001 [Paramecium tetraurelia]CAK95047.1 unnamed protein product [Paramecium tetraurelia]|eukprot:XP_001462420.1 hypothetical protein (macronuclear) [Paramecium tetraurelia strain d4-2]